MTRETNPTPPQVEFARPPDMRPCVEHTHLTASTTLWSPLGEGIEERYLAEEYYQTDQPAFFELTSVSEAMFDPEVVGEDVEALASEERLAELERSAQGAGEAWAGAMVALAASHGLTRETALTPGDETSWKIYPAEDRTPLLVATIDGQNLSVRLDDVYERQPQEVQENIRAYHRAKLLQDLGLQLQAVSRYHELSMEDVAPDFARRMASLPVEEQAMTRTEILMLMSLFGQSNEHLESLGRRADNLRNVLVNRQGRYVGQVLGHMARCPIQPENIKQWATGLSNFYFKLNRREYYDQPIGALTEPQKTYLRHPYMYLPGRAEKVAAASRQEAAEKRMFAELIMSAHETSDPEVLIAAFQAELPEVYAKYEAFKEVVETNAFSSVSLGSMIKRAVNQLTLPLRDEVSTERHLQEFERQLTMSVMLQDRQYPSIYDRRGRGGGLEVAGEDLRTVVALLVNKHARAAIEANPARGTGPLAAYDEEKLIQLKALELKLIGEYRDKEAQSLEHAEQSIEAGRVGDEARRSLGITDEDNTWLAQMHEPENTDNPLDPTLFNTVLLTLLAEKQGIIRDLTSPVIQSFIREFLKNPYSSDPLSPGREGKLQELGWVQT